MKKLDRVDERMRKYESNVRLLQNQIPELLKTGASGSISLGQEKDKDMGSATASGTGDRGSSEVFGADIAEAECSFARDNPSPVDVQVDLCRFVLEAVKFLVASPLPFVRVAAPRVVPPDAVRQSRRRSLEARLGHPVQCQPVGD